MERTQCRGRCDLSAGSGLRLSQAGSARLAGREPRRTPSPSSCLRTSPRSYWRRQRIDRATSCRRAGAGTCATSGHSK